MTSTSARAAGRTASVPTTARERARDEITAEIRAQARRQLADVGAVGLSLRAVARELGMVSSAIYRYYPSRDELLTALLIECYDELGVAVETADRRVRRRDDLHRRWTAQCHAVRDWAKAHPHDCVLLFGSPIPGYVAPPDTIGPGTRVQRCFLGLVLRAHQLRPDFVPATPPVSRRLHRALAGVREFARSTAEGDELRAGGAAGAGLPDGLLVAALNAWTLIFGAVWFETEGQLRGAVDDEAALFGFHVDSCADLLGLR